MPLRSLSLLLKPSSQSISPLIPMSVSFLTSSSLPTSLARLGRSSPSISTPSTSNTTINLRHPLLYYLDYGEKCLTYLNPTHKFTPCIKLRSPKMTEIVFILLEPCARPQMYDPISAISAPRSMRVPPIPPDRYPRTMSASSHSVLGKSLSDTTVTIIVATHING